MPIGEDDTNCASRKITVVNLLGLFSRRSSALEIGVIAPATAKHF